VFPFDFDAAATNDVVRLAPRGALVLATALATLVMAILAVVEVVRSAFKT